MGSLSTRLDHWIDWIYLNPELIEKEWQRKKMLVIATLVANGMVIILTLFAFLINAKPVAWMGIAFLILHFVDYFLLRSKNYLLYHTIYLAAYILVAGAFILVMGGILNSCGVILVGLVCAFSSNMLNTQKGAIALMVVYILTILIAALLNPYLLPHPTITPRINFTFWVINVVWISIYLVQFNNQYFKEKSALEEAETKRIRELDETKTRIYTSITHEFRTPLTLILGMADEIDRKDTSLSHETQLIRKNSNHLLRLVNQILALKKLESGTMVPQYVLDDIIPFLKYQVEAFHSIVEKKDLELICLTPMDRLIMDFDPEKMEVILTNLLSNAIKFSNSPGKITVIIDKNAGCPASIEGNVCLHLQVSDQGKGIPADQLPYIFDRYYQVDDHSHLSAEGSGIGLTLVKEYVKLLGGMVRAESILHQGTTFDVFLPIHTQAASTSRKLTPEIPAKQASSLQKSDTFSHPTKALPVLLIVEDHTDMVDYLTSLLYDHYQLLIANHGKEGLVLAQEKIPDIIISDVMMPEMDGFEFLKTLKGDLRTSHIPVILLTALADTPSLLEGLESGAEAYLTKPFIREELFLRLEKLLEIRKILHTRYAQFEFDPSTSPGTSQEDHFIKEVRAALEKYGDDEEFGVDELCREMMMSRTQLYRKFSALTDTTVHKYMRTFRLKKALHLLRTTDLNVTQVALAVGFTNPAHFSRIFTEEFDINPGQIRFQNPKLAR